MRDYLLLLLLLGSTTACMGASDVHGQALVGDKPTPDAVIWLDAPTAPKVAPRQRVVLDQRNLTFYPHVLAVSVGTTVDFPNSDRVFHNVFSFHDGRRFDLGLYPVGTSRKVKFDRPGLSKIFCNIHPNMAAYVMVVDTPYFAVSGRKGDFTLPSVPAGTYTYHAWRPGGATLSGSIVIQPGVPVEVRWP
ncbi:MAG: methylamine utilization protein [Armatimonadetes bacterium]|nr:methylamine utilization protein [Armatimonadota bacterium]